MPTYDYRCTNEECTIRFEMQTTIVERDFPTEVPCPACGGKIERYLAAPPIWGREKGKVPETFKDVLRAVKKRNPGSVINTDGIS